MEGEVWADEGRERLNDMENGEREREEFEEWTGERRETE